MRSNAAFDIFILSIVLSASGVASAQNCAVSYRRDCGVVGTTEVRNDILTIYCIIMSSVCPSYYTGPVPRLWLLLEPNR